MIPKRPRTLALAAGGVVVLGGAGLAAVGFGGHDGAAPARSKLPPATASIEKTTLTEIEEADGTLGYGDTHTLSGGGGHGTLTGLAAEGRTVSQGEPVYKVDAKPVPLLYGSLPLYRTLRSGVEGTDVRQLERNLQDLGYTGFTVDKTFSSATADAVRRWQEDLGVAETGKVEPGAVVIAPGAIRVGEHKKAKGDPASGPVLTYTGTAQIVTVNLDVKLQQLAKKGAGATVELPGGDTVKGKITKVGTVATRPSQESDESTVKITVALRERTAAAGLDQAPVQVQLTSERHPDVLAVPVSALLALPDGGYGVQVVQGAAVRTVSVETGMFADGKVEITGTGLAEGMKVGIPK